MVDRQELQKAVDANYKAFLEQLPELLDSHRGQIALLHDNAPAECYEFEQCNIFVRLIERVGGG